MGKFVGLLFVLLGVVACGPMSGIKSNISGNQGSNTGEVNPPVVFDKLELANKAFTAAHVSCDQGRCPEYVGALFIRKEPQDFSLISACSITYLGDNKIMTNAHCVPVDLAAPGVNCTQRMKISFPANGNRKREKFECDKIIALSTHHDRVEQPDWAIIQFTGETERKGAKVSSEGMGLNQVVFMHKVNFASDLINNMIITTRCYSNTPHNFQRENVGRKGAMVNISDCNLKLIKGNSGSGIFASTGRLVGVFSFLTGVDGKLLGYNYPDMKQNFGGGTNLACVPYFTEKPDPRCDYDPFTFRPTAELYKLLQQHLSLPLQVAQLQREAVSINRDIEKYVVLDGRKESLKSLTFPELKGINGAAEYVLGEALAFMLPQIPTCVMQLPETERLRLATLIIQDEQAVVDPDIFWAERNSQLRSVELSIEEVSQGTYLLEGKLDLNRLRPRKNRKMGQRQTDMSQEGVAFQMEIPACSRESSQ